VLNIFFCEEEMCRELDAVRLGRTKTTPEEYASYYPGQTGKTMDMSRIFVRLHRNAQKIGADRAKNRSIKVVVTKPKRMGCVRINHPRRGGASCPGSAGFNKCDLNEMAAGHLL
jgi:hypothetical protein